MTTSLISRHMIERDGYQIALAMHCMKRHTYDNVYSIDAAVMRNGVTIASGYSYQRDSDIEPRGYRLQELEEEAITQGLERAEEIRRALTA